MPVGAPKGNQNAAKAKRFQYELEKLLDSRDVGGLRDIIAKLVDKAIEGEAWAIQMIAERLDGKPVQESHNKHEHLHQVVEIGLSEIDSWIEGVYADGEAGETEGPVSH